MKAMIIDPVLGVIEYLETVNELASGYYDEDGAYQPHIGLVRAMCVFYNRCVKESQFDDLYDHDVIDPTEIGAILSDQEFILEFNRHIQIESVCLNFANAFRDAMDIVNTKKGSMDRILSGIKKLILQFSEFSTDENMDRIHDIADKFSKGELDVDAFMASYGNSEMMKKMLEEKKKAE